MPRALGRNLPPDKEHIEKYPFKALETFKPGPVVLGINWYEGFDSPDLNDKIHIAGEVRGGHCICVEPATQKDLAAFHIFYDQGSEGACEGFGHSRAMSLIYRRTFDAFWLYDDARREEHQYPQGEGSTNRSACKALQQWGDHYEGGTHCIREPWKRGMPGQIIKSYHWATSAKEVLHALGYPSDTTEVPLLNSWGTEYPQRVYLSTKNLQQLLEEEGEASLLVTQ